MTRARLKLVLIIATFALPFLLAVALHKVDYRPVSTRNRGQLLAPPVDLSTLDVRMEADARWAWTNQQQVWTLVLRVPADCAAACWDAVEGLTRLRATLGRHSPRLKLLLLDRQPPAERREALKPVQYGAAVSPVPPPLDRDPAEAPALWLADPHGFLVIAYAPGFALGDVKADLKKLIK